MVFVRSCNKQHGMKQVVGTYISQSNDIGLDTAKVPLVNQIYLIIIYTKHRSNTKKRILAHNQHTVEIASTLVNVSVA